MAKAGAVLSALCILAFAIIAHCNPIVYKIEGNVYCDPCRVEFETKLSSVIQGATVRLECRHVDSDNVTYRTEGVTDESGHYTLTVEGEHGDEICEVLAVKSPRGDCNEAFEGYERASIVLSERSGISGGNRYVNPLGFKTEHSVEQCKEVLDQLGYFPLQQN